MKSNISNLLQLEYNCRNAQNYEELRYIIVNQTRNLISYDKAVFLSFNYGKKLKIEAISDISTIDYSSSFVQTVQNISNKIYNSKNNGFHKIDCNHEIDEYERDRLIEARADNPLWIPIKISRQNVEEEYFLILFKSEPWEQKELDLCTHISSSFSYFLFATTKHKQKFNFFGSFNYFKFIFVILILSMFIPIRLTVLAPLEVSAKNPFVVTSPLDAAINKIEVSSNEFVKKDTLIVKLNDIDYLNRYKIANKSLSIAKAQLYTAQQASFYDNRQKSQLENLKAQVALKQSELDFAKEQLDRTKIFAKKDGIAIIHNPNEWEGKPVVTGERILFLANKNEIELKIMLPVSDAIFLKENATVKAFLDNDPLNSWNAKIKHISYKPEVNEQNILSYRIIADFDDLDVEKLPTIGLRGTAKIYSSEVTLFFYLFKKPITSLRQLIGW